jgi:hypothetical protein
VDAGTAVLIGGLTFRCSQFCVRLRLKKRRKELEIYKRPSARCITGASFWRALETGEAVIEFEA